MNGQNLVHSLTRLSNAVPTINELSTIWQVQWMSRCCFIHLLDHHMLFQQWTTSLIYHRFNERPEPSPFTYSIIISYSNNLRPVHNITGSMNGQILVHSLTPSAYGIPTIDDLSTISQFQWTARFLVHSLTRSSYAIPTVDVMFAISHVNWKNKSYCIHSLDHHMLFHKQTTYP
jgi:hypothetical protein